MTATVFDAIVIGLGGMGSAAAAELARRGRRVLGLEQHALGHALGSSHGHTRVIRQAYFEHPNYVPLCQHAYERWFDLEQRTGQHLLTVCGVLSLGPADGVLIRGVRQAARDHDLPIEELTADDLHHRYPVFRLPPEAVGVLEPLGGFLYVDRCVAACQALARQYGADLHEQEAVVGWEAQGSGVAVRTVRGAYHAARLILTPGPWAVGLLGPFARCLTVMRQVPLWFGTGADRAFRRDQFPIYITDFAEGHFYGFPVLDGHGHKAARHYGAPELPGPDGVSREVTADDEAPVRAFLHRYLPVANGPVRRSAVCLYTLTPDRHFLVGLHPEHPQVALAAGFSGHGFKFASVMGDVLADLADRGRTGHAIEMFRPTRFLQAAGC